ncbi:type VI secretion system Vgr family protein [Polyangium aurulentum]|uniref:type VI secretion system Vgr family protein n=1 Tax=Polyangium aurulentum TaxID=2567896 RepID=UPI0010ADBE14|nr:type VI secretion system tip protein TssI/VgrG [Polyangium aurulentum]UQA54605.1 type VI secretion system tip protein VgrG [Polyangium aurulentum]
MSDYDFRFAWEGAEGSPWGHLVVAQFRGQEAMSTPYRYELLVASKTPSPEVDPADLVGRRGTLRIATVSEPACRVVHGVIAEAEELHPVPEGMLYRVVLMPPIVRAQHRKRCRVFLDKTLRQIIDAVLQGDPNLKREDGLVAEPDDGTSADYTTALERFAWRITDPSRIDDRTVRPFVVQYNESDLAFVSRLLEEEGISYHYENGDGLCLLVLSDADSGRTRLAPFAPCGHGVTGREVTMMKLGARLRTKAVRLDDFDWKKPALDLAADAVTDMDLVEYHYPGGFQETPNQGKLLAKAVLERYGVEADYATGEGKVRLLSAGTIFQLEHAKPRYEGEYLVTALEVRGEQKGAVSLNGAWMDVPFTCKFECARRGKDGTVSESHFRPARVTPKPRIVGSQTAFVTAAPGAEGAEIHVGGPPGGEIGCVRLRFHWDRDPARHAKEPTSCWVRVSQMFAGAGMGGVWHPRVGVEVIVEFLEGDPDRPIVTGRVYNGANLPAAPGAGAPTISSFRSLSSPGGGTYNELAFDCAAGAEAINMHAGKDWNSQVNNDRAENVGNNSSSSVGVDRSEATGANRSTSVGANNTEMIGGNESVSVGANQTASVGVNQSVSVGVNQSTNVGANQSTAVGANQSVVVGANQSTSIGAMHAVFVGADETVTVGANQTTAIGASHTVTVGADETISIGANQTVGIGAAHAMTVGSTQTLNAGGAQTIHSDASQTLTAPTQTLAADATISASAGAVVTVEAPLTCITGSGVLILTGPTTFMTGGTISIQGGTVAINGGSVSVTGGGGVSVSGGPAVNVSAGVIKLN